MESFKEDVWKNKRERNDFLIALAVIALFLIGGFVLVGGNDASQVEDVALSEPVVEIRTDEDGHTTEYYQREEDWVQSLEASGIENSNQRWAYTQTEPIAYDDQSELVVIVPVEVEPRVYNQPNEMEFQEIPEDEIIAEQQRNFDEAQDPVEGLLKDSVDMRTTLDETIDLEPVEELYNDSEQIIQDEEETNVVVAEPIRKPKEKPSGSQSKVAAKKACKIMVGAYKNKEMADRMAKRVTAAKYDLYRSRKGNFYTVGLLVSCDQNLIDRTLKAVRAKFNEEAYIKR